MNTYEQQTLMVTAATQQATSATTVVLADDHPLFRQGLRQLLEADPALDVVGEASDGREATRLVRELRPDVLLLDLVMPVATGLDALRALSTLTPSSRTRTLLLTADIGESDLIEALHLGARGVVMKSDACELLFKSIRTVMAGQYWLGRECMGTVIDKMRHRASGSGPETLQPTFGLTPRELEVVATVCGGYPNRDIAQKFSITIKTVKHHLTRIFDKVGVSNRLELALFAVHHRLESLVPADEARAFTPPSRGDSPT